MCTIAIAIALAATAIGRGACAGQSDVADGASERAACEEAVQNAHQGDEVRVNGATYLITDEQQLEASTELQQIAIPLDYDLGFVLTPGETTKEGWANIIHVSATGKNCCNYGDRIPGIWFYANTYRFHIRDGSPSEGNAGCDPTEHLTQHVATAVRDEVRAFGGDERSYIIRVARSEAHEALEPIRHDAAGLWCGLTGGARRSSRQFNTAGRTGSHQLRCGCFMSAQAALASVFHR